uniref:PK_Tyr_Ser-Thr domain-containing protein n=1 Tax=Gongylonema pulchrum TaxID=637853 RepID=A0A183DGK4_9BILA
LGIKPWPDELNKKIATNIRHIRMPQLPAIMPAPIKALVGTIWVKNPEERPHFKVICKKIREMQKGDLKPPAITECSVNRIANVKRAPYTKIEVSDTEEPGADVVTEHVMPQIPEHHLCQFSFEFVQI